MDSFDSDVLIYAAIDGHPLGERIRMVILGAEPRANIGSALLVPEVLIKPTRLDRNAELLDLNCLLSWLDLRHTDARTVDLAVEFGSRYRLKTVDAMHLATAVNAGADRFITNNRRDFTKEITEVDVTYPGDLH